MNYIIAVDYGQNQSRDFVHVHWGGVRKVLRSDCKMWHFVLRVQPCCSGGWRILTQEGYVLSGRTNERA